MNKITNEDGFTLIDILVSINITFIALAIFISFYLFAKKYMDTSAKKVEVESEIIDFLNKTKSTLKKSQDFTLSFYPDSIIITTDRMKTIALYKAEISNNNLKLLSFDKYEINVTCEDKTVLTAMTDKKEMQSAYYLSKNVYSIDEIESIEIIITLHNKSFRMYYPKPDIAVKKFRNITN